MWVDREHVRAVVHHGRSTAVVKAIAPSGDFSRLPADAVHDTDDGQQVQGLSGLGFTACGV